MLLLLASAVAVDQVAVICCWAYAVYLVRLVQPASPVDAAIMFYGGQGDPILDEETIHRLEAGLHLYKSRRAANILCVGGYRKGLKLSGSVRMAQWLAAAGIPKYKIWTDSWSYDTPTNIRAAFQIAKQANWRSLVFVSSPVHLVRILHIAEAWDASISVYASTYRDDDARLLSLWLKRVIQVHREWFATVAYNLIPHETYDRIVRWLRAVD